MSMIAPSPLLYFLYGIMGFSLGVIWSIRYGDRVTQIIGLELSDIRSWIRPQFLPFLVWFVLGGVSAGVVVICIIVLVVGVVYGGTTMGESAFVLATGTCAQLLGGVIVGMIVRLMNEILKQL